MLLTVAKSHKREGSLITFVSSFVFGRMPSVSRENAIMIIYTVFTAMGMDYVVFKTQCKVKLSREDNTNGKTPLSCFNPAPLSMTKLVKRKALFTVHI